MNGVLNVFKPCGMTSFDVVRKVKKVAHTKKVGHTGTLDPEATGVLPICIGRATKLVDYLMSSSKVYRAELLLGTITDTYDREGKVLKTSEVNLSEEEVISAINSFVGDIMQVPPMYSALKVNGQKLYDLARKGIEIERAPRPLTIFEINIIDIDLPKVVFDVKCSKGTYIRSLCYDIGEKLGCGGAMWGLNRVSTGVFKIEDAISIDDLTEDNLPKYLISIEEALSSYPKIVIDSHFYKLLNNGVKIFDKRVTDMVEKNVLYKTYSEMDPNISYEDECNIPSDFIGLGLRDDLGFQIVKFFNRE